MVHRVELDNTYWVFGIGFKVEFPGEFETKIGDISPYIR
jgi:hypothetical protein